MCLFDLELGFVIRGISTWQTMYFSSSNLNTSNVIKVGIEVTSDGIVRGGAQVMKELSEYIRGLMDFGFIPMMPKYGFFTLEIENSPTYHEEEFREDELKVRSEDPVYL